MSELTWINALVLVALAVGAVELFAIVLRVVTWAWPRRRAQHDGPTDAGDRAIDR